MIRTRSLSKSFSTGRRKVQALSDVSLFVDTGMTLTVMGKSGSGKTTLLNCIGGIERPDTGSVECFGVDIHALSKRDLSLFQRRNAGFVFQAGNLLSYLTVSENIAFPLVLNAIPNKEKDRRVLELLEKIELSDAARAMPYELSGGEAQRVAFARAIAHCPKMLLADEPTASLDTETGKNLVKLMFTMGKEEKCTIIISTHDQEIIKLSYKSLNIRDGKVKGPENE
ncbi:MAG: methionine import ATP-binding protein MetN [Desulfobacteraceae bacterium A6]|nr:MAG: methionine import ATP-binding protein MetN [Desulfobacteraceae bacterium A6]